MIRYKFREKTIQYIFIQKKKIINQCFYTEYTGLPIRSEGSIQSADSGRLPRSHAAAQEEEEASPLVSSLPQNPAEEGRVVESRPQFHSLRSPRTAL